MAITVYCKCGWCTDIELTSESNPHRCPECGGEILLNGTETPLYVDGMENPILFAGDDEQPQPRLIDIVRDTLGYSL